MTGASCRTMMGGCGVVAGDNATVVVVNVVRRRAC